MISKPVLDLFKKNWMSNRSLLDIIRIEPDDEKIIDTFEMLYKEDALVFSFGGTFPFNTMVLSIPPEKWEEMIKIPTIKSILRENYRKKISLKEMLRMRNIMWTFMTRHYHIDRAMPHHGNPATWSFFHSTNKIWEIAKRYE